MPGKLKVQDKGAYFQVTAEGDVSREHLIAVYYDLFHQHKGADDLYILIDIRKHPSVLGMEDFVIILNDADSCKIKRVHITVVSKDQARPVIGEMLIALSKNFDVEVDIQFFMTMETAQKAVEDSL